MMPKPLQGVSTPTLMLWLCAVAIGVVGGAGPGSAMLSKRADVVSRVAFPLVIASWVTADARKRGRQLCYDFDSFVFFAWPVVVPVYLFQTRGLRAFITLLCFAGIWTVAAIVGLVVSLVFINGCRSQFPVSARGGSREKLVCPTDSLSSNDSLRPWAAPISIPL